MFARRHFLAGAVVASAVALPRLAAAQSYPSRPLRWVVPFPAGGSTDLIARLLGEWLAQKLGQPVVIENKPGGGTNIGVQAVVNAAPDGYTLLFALATNTINPSLYKSLPFDFQRDIAPVAGLAELPLVFDLNPSVPAKTVPEFIAYAKTNPGKINFASFGTRTISHLAIELFKIAAGVDIVHVPYQGGAPMLTDLLSGRIQAGIDALPNSLPHIRSGALRALAVTGPARSAAVPEVPTLGESVPGYEVSGWTGIGVPTGTPAAIVATLNREINAGLADARIAARLAEVGGRPIAVSAEEFGQLWRRDTDKWAKVVKFAAAKRE